jgi:broad specificity phosphatase PhoE
VAVFTSGGPIGVCVQSALQAPRAVALRVNWRVKNASLTEFVFSKGRLSLEYFNHVFYLDKDLQTFR